MKAGTGSGGGGTGTELLPTKLPCSAGVSDRARGHAGHVAMSEIGGGRTFYGETECAGPAGEGLDGGAEADRGGKVSCRDGTSEQTGLGARRGPNSGRVVVVKELVQRGRCHSSQNGDRRRRRGRWNTHAKKPVMISSRIFAEGTWRPRSCANGSA